MTATHIMFYVLFGFFNPIKISVRVKGQSQVAESPFEEITLIHTISNI